MLGMEPEAMLDKGCRRKQPLSWPLVESEYRLVYGEEHREHGVSMWSSTWPPYTHGKGLSFPLALLQLCTPG